MPDASTGCQRCAVARHGATRGGPRPQQCDYVTPKTPNQPGQALRQYGEPTFPRPAAWKAAMFPQQGTQLLWERVILVQKRQQGIGGREAADNHHD
jgi:hypothetical protein